MAKFNIDLVTAFISVLSKEVITYFFETNFGL